MKAEVSPEMRKVICETVWKLAQADACILVFLPGIGEIGALQDDLEASTHAGVALQVLVLHSLDMYVCLYIHNMLLYTWRCAAGAGAALAGAQGGAGPGYGAGARRPLQGDSVDQHRRELDHDSGRAGGA